MLLTAWCTVLVLLKMTNQQEVRQPLRKLCWPCSASQICSQSSHRLLCSVGFALETSLLGPALQFQGQVSDFFL